MDTTLSSGGNTNVNGTEKKNKNCHNTKDHQQQEQIEKLIRSLDNLQTPEQKIASLAKNVIDLDRQRNNTLKMNEKQMEAVFREKDHLQKEYNKGVLIRNKLEQVCREQQKLMKSIKSESMAKIKEEEEKRKETQARFQQSINEIFVTLGKNNEENTKLKDANSEMTKKFKYLAEQYDVRERQLEKIHEQISLETQLNEAKLAKLKMETTIEREILLKEKESALDDLLATKTLLVEMQSREKTLKGQLSLYTEKYEDFQNSLQKSNDIFSSYKSEIDKLAKKTKFLEKECYEWRVKFEKSNKAILVMATDKQAQDQYMAKAARQLAQLQKLCRTLQAERTSLLDVLKANNIERPPMPELPPEPTDIEPPPKSADKLDIMSRNCLEMKKTLAELQGQMNALTTEKTKTEETIPNSSTAAGSVKKPSKSKKSKSKASSCSIKERRSSATAAAVVPTVAQPAIPVLVDEQQPIVTSPPLLSSVTSSPPPPTVAESNKIEQLAERIAAANENENAIIETNAEKENTDKIENIDTTVIETNHDAVKQELDDNVTTVIDKELIATEETVDTETITETVVEKPKELDEITNGKILPETACKSTVNEETLTKPDKLASNEEISSSTPIVNDVSSI